MRKFLLAATVACGVTVGGCSTVQVTDFLAQVQASTAQACLFVPTIETILAVAQALGIPAVGIVGSAIGTVANAICQQVPPPASARYKALLPRGTGPAKTVGSVNGVVVNGWRV